MSSFHEFLADVLADRRIDDAEVPRIREYLYEDGRLNLDDVKLLIEIYCGAIHYCPEFEDLFFSVLEEVILDDGQIEPSEQFYLLKMLYSDREIRDREKDLLLKLRERAEHVTPEFEALCDEALKAHPTAWSVGGR
ncbi:MAG TPA: hypothetical protein VMY42_16215 [Thermoguttaceae bacterium]|nr:hypothetical protein [Thermoguttaceae bacterium]